jgi:acetyl esterase/lipase
MPRLSILALLGLVACQVAYPAEPLPQPDFAIMNRLAPEDPMPERATRWSNPAVSMTDVVYRVLPGYRPLHLDLYRPVVQDTPRPLIVFVHGGAWANANPRVGASYANFPDVLAYLVQRGYVVASVQYRFSREAPFPAPLDDLQTAVQFLRQNAARFGIDGARIGLWGMSAGAQLAALAAVDCAKDACVDALAGWFGPYDLRPPYPDDSVLREFLACGVRACEPGVLAAASPLLYVDAGDPPTLLVQGDQDRNGLPAQAQAFAAALRAAGVSAELEMVPGVGHGLVGRDIAATRAALRTGLGATVNFFDRELRASPAVPAVTH